MEPVGDAKCVLQHGHGTTLTRHGIPKRPSHSLAGQRPVLSGSSPRLLQSHAGQRPALPGAMCTRSPAGVAPIMPVTACIVGAGLKPAPTNDGFHPPTAPCGPAARAPRSNVHPFTRCCRTDHARHRMHSGGRFETCPHPWCADAPNDGFHPPTAPCGPAARAPRLSGDGCPTTVNIARPPLRHLPLLSYTRGNIR